MIRLNPKTAQQWKRFKGMKRGYWSFLLLSLLALAAVFAEWLASNRAVLVHYKAHWYVPVYGAIHTGREFGFDYDYEVDYRALQARMKQDPKEGFVIMPPVPYGPDENCYPNDEYKPHAPDASLKHYLGTDQVNRDILTRLLYGLRNSLIFAGGFTFLTYLIGVTIGASMGYFGGWYDLTMQRFVEIWALMPFLLVVIIVRAAIPQGMHFGLGILLAIVVVFGWVGITYYVRTATYKEKARDYVAAAQVLGASTPRIIFRHILPNVLSLLVTFLPFTAAAAIASLTALDYLGFGLPPPMPSWGELLRAGTDNLDSPWIVSSAFVALSLNLTLITFVGEAIREAFDPKKFTYYR